MKTEIDLKALRHLQYGVYIVSSHKDGKANAQIATVVFQITNSPVRICTCINKQTLTHDFIMSSKEFGVSVLSEEADLKYMSKFGFCTGRLHDKLSEVEYKKTVSECPLVLSNATSVFDLKVTETIDFETHTMFVGTLTYAEKLNDKKPMTYDYYQRVIKGKNHKFSPSFNDD